jgi:hypothetical protein
MHFVTFLAIYDPNLLIKVHYNVYVVRVALFSQEKLCMDL